MTARSNESSGASLRIGSRQTKPAAGQLRTAIPAQKIERPTASPVFPATPGKRAQPKTMSGAQNRQAPAAPDVYRSQPAPGALQTKSALIQSPHVVAPPARAVAPPVYRPQARTTVQAKVNSPQRTSPPPVYRPQMAPKVLQTHRPLAQNLLKGQARLQPVAPPVYRLESRKTVQPKTSQQAKLSTAPPVYRPEKKNILPATASALSQRSRALFGATAQRTSVPAKIANSVRPVTAKRIASPLRAVQMAKATKGRKECFAAVVAKDGQSYPGAYKNGMHAEIQALENYFGSGGKVAGIERIDLSSRPCKYCYLILGDLGVRGKVQVDDDDREFGSCSGGSYGWFDPEGSVWEALKKAGYKDQEKYISSVIERQREL